LTELKVVVLEWTWVDGTNAGGMWKVGVEVCMFGALSAVHKLGYRHFKSGELSAYLESSRVMGLLAPGWRSHATLLH
jgi:hypothetical protein